MRISDWSSDVCSSDLVPPPIDDSEAFWSPAEKAMVEQSLACTVLGDEDQLRAGISAFVERHRPDELLLTANIFDHAERKRSFAIAAEACRGLPASPKDGKSAAKPITPRPLAPPGRWVWPSVLPTHRITVRWAPFRTKPLDDGPINRRTHQ